MVYVSAAFAVPAATGDASIPAATAAAATTSLIFLIPSVPFCRKRHLALGLRATDAAATTVLVFLIFRFFLLGNGTRTWSGNGQWTQRACLPGL
jgi:uncharacterized membrane protein YozB (DUF420 family)